jgi:hypothetical protein
MKNVSCHDEKIEAYCNTVCALEVLEGYDADEAEVMEAEPVPHVEDWRAKYLAWIDRGELPPDRSEARRIVRMAKSFTIVDGELYKCAASGILQRCIPIPHGRELIRDIHAGMCGHHAPSWAPHSAQASTSPSRSLKPMRSYAHARGGSSMLARLISRLIPCKRFPSHGLSACGGWTSWALARGTRGLHSPAGRRG